MKTVYTLLIAATALTGSLWAAGTAQVVELSSEAARAIQAEMVEQCHPDSDVAQANAEERVDRFMIAAYRFYDQWDNRLPRGEIYVAPDRAFIVAAALGYFRMLQLLLLKGANPRAHGDLALALAQDPKIIQALERMTGAQKKG